MTKKGKKGLKTQGNIHTQCVYSTYINRKKVPYVHFLKREFRHRSFIG